MGKGMLIVVGSGRSGTVYLTEILKKICFFGFAGEPKFVYTWYKKYFSGLDFNDSVAVEKALRKVYRSPFFNHLRNRKKIATDFQELLSFVPPDAQESYEDFIEGIFKYVAKIRGWKYPAYKDPLDVKYVAELAELMPHAKFLHVVRDGRDVAASLFHMPWGANNIYTGARFWADGAYKGSVDGKLLGDRYLEIKYEDFLLDPEKIATELDNFQLPLTGEQKKEELLNFLKDNTKFDSNYKWKNTFTPEMLKLFERSAGKELQYFGYETGKFAVESLPVYKKVFYKLDDLIRRIINATFHRNVRFNRKSISSKKIVRYAQE